MTEAEQIKAHIEACKPLFDLQRKMLVDMYGEEAVIEMEEEFYRKQEDLL
jgi:hypothetical protein